MNGGRVRPDYRLKRGRRRSSSAVARTDRRRTERCRRAGLLDVLAHRISMRTRPSSCSTSRPGLAVHGGSGIEHGVIEALRALFPDERGLELAHRLDRDTSGCLVASAQSCRAAGVARRLSRCGRSQRPMTSSSTGRGRASYAGARAPRERYVTRTGERRVRVLADGKPARTEFSIVERNDRASWLKAHPHTGRTHQIRVHCLTSGHPVVGDEKYASDTLLEQSRALGIARLCLHATSVAIPVGGKVRRFDAPLPEDFIAAWRRLSGA